MLRHWQPNSKKPELKWRSSNRIHTTFSKPAFGRLFLLKINSIGIFFSQPHHFYQRSLQPIFRSNYGILPLFLILARFCVQKTPKICGRKRSIHYLCPPFSKTSFQHLNIWWPIYSKQRKWNIWKPRVFTWLFNAWWCLHKCQNKKKTGLTTYVFYKTEKQGKLR